MLHAFAFEVEGLVKKRRRTFKLNYWLHLPSAFETSRRKWPVVLFLHGSGERGDALRKVLKHGPPKLVRQGYDLPCIVIAPQCPERTVWHQHFPALVALVQHVIEGWRGDPRRVALTGISMGGYGAWELAAEVPGLWSCVLPICGGASTKRGFPKAVKRMAHLPVWAVHGAKDKAVPLRETLALTDALRALDANPMVTIHPRMGHDVWTRTYLEEDVWQWLLNQRKARE